MYFPRFTLYFLADGAGWGGLETSLEFYLLFLHIFLCISSQFYVFLHSSLCVFLAIHFYISSHVSGETLQAGRSGDIS